MTFLRLKTLASTTAAAALITLLTLGGPAAQAQMKIGSNPTSLATGANLQVEATDGTQMVVRKSTVQVGIGTTNPGNKLEINSASSGSSGVRLTQLPSAPLLGTDANGDVVKVVSSSACTCGDIKASVVSANHGDWKLMNGTSYTGTCGTYAMNASNAVLVQGGTVGTSSTAGGVTLAQNQLPNVTLGGSTNTTGSHGHNFFTWQVTLSGSQTYPGVGYIKADSWNTVNVSSNSLQGVQTAGDHSHSITTNSLNGGVTQVPITLSTSNLPRLNVNYFVCIN